MTTPPERPPALQQPHHGGPGAAPTGQRRWLPWAVAGAILVLLLAIGGLVVALTGGDADSVEDVADQSVEAAEDLDIDAAFDLFCDDPGADAREQIERMIELGQDRAGTDDPEVDYEVSDVTGDKEGSFHVTATSGEEGISEDKGEATVIVESRDGRSCIADIEDFQHTRDPTQE